MTNKNIEIQLYNLLDKIPNQPHNSIDLLNVHYLKYENENIINSFLGFLSETPMEAKLFDFYPLYPPAPFLHINP